MINTIKDNIYSFFINAMAIEYPSVFPLVNGFSEKIYWKKVRDEAPQKPYIVLNDVVKGKINRACEIYRRPSDNKLIKRENWMMRITFSVYNQGTENNLATPEREANDYIEYIADLFNSPTTFETLSNNGIIVNEKQTSDIRDLSTFEQSNYSFRYEIDVTFEFDIIKEPQDYGIGERVGLDINVKDTDLYIQEEIIGD